MKIMYGARMARQDLLRAVCVLARMLTKWDELCDRRLLRLISYINYTLGYRLRGWVGGKRRFLEHHSFYDTDFAGCVETQRSTTGSFHMIYGPSSQLPIAMVSKRQSCVSHSTPESEIVAMHTTLRTVTIPMMELWKPLIPGLKVLVFEDNESMLQVMKTGRNPTMLHLGRTHRVSFA